MVRSDRFAGRRVWVNDALVAFADDGSCLGIVGYADGRTQDPPAPLRPQDIEVMRQLSAFSVQEGSQAQAADGESADSEVERLVEAHTRAELVEMAQERGIDVPERATKRQIAEMLAGAD